MGIKYVPILKWKRGERYALLNLNDSVRKKMIPLISIVSEIEPNSLVDSIMLMLL